MIRPGDYVTKVIIYKTDNVNDEGYEGYEISIYFGNKMVDFVETTIDELEDEPRGIYKFDGEKYINIENHE